MEETEGMYMTLHDARAKEALQKEHFVRSRSLLTRSDLYDRLTPSLAERRNI
jgi:hypothetical protein